MRLLHNTVESARGGQGPPRGSYLDQRPLQAILELAPELDGVGIAGTVVRLYRQSIAARRRAPLIGHAFTYHLPDVVYATGVRALLESPKHEFSI
jgi:hypothetical protein